MPFEIQFIDDGKELVCDVYIDAHHVSFTSNSPLLLANAKSDSLAEGKILIRITSANGDNEKKYKSVNKQMEESYSSQHTNNEQVARKSREDGDNFDYPDPRNE